ncbi:MAG: ABC transporter ATP-binding protein [Amphritea sp.]
MLTLENINSYYDKSHVLFDLSLNVGEGELVSLLGRNGAGKSTTLLTIMGLVKHATGSVRYKGSEILGQPTYKSAAAGLCLVPEQRDIFQDLTVEENLKISQMKQSPWSISDIYNLFPRLEERRRNGGGQLSGGEQQMLALARALLNHPRVLLLDEPSEGLAPVIVKEIVEILKKIKESGISILLVEQNLRVCEVLADRHYILEQGRLIFEASRAEFSSDEAETIKQKYLAV